ncbi:hypothetical protein C8R43DRAFT_956097 [Mycena crocata]|nr:hypothetical protein C8R43DRAFT_956097 [Mycena crocata]
MEIISMILLAIPLRDKISFAATSRTHRTIVGRTVLTCAARRLKPYGLSLSDARLLQTGTRCFISGDLLKDLLFGQSDGNTAPHPLPASPNPNQLADTLDIYCATEDGPIVSDFIQHATGASVSTFVSGAALTELSAISALTGIRRAYILTKTPGKNIRVFETTSDNPLDVIFHFPTTADMSAWLVDRIWHAYPQLSLNGLAITTPQRLPVNTIKARQRTWNIMQCAIEYNLTLQTSLTQWHKCGSAYSCPLSPRATNDSGCMSVAFGNLPWSSTTNEDPWNKHDEVGWTLGSQSFG